LKKKMRYLSADSNSMCVNCQPRIGWLPARSKTTMKWCNDSHCRQICRKIDNEFVCRFYV
jgi:hypothetical protein